MTAAPRRGSHPIDATVTMPDERAAGSSDTARPSGVPHDEPSYADFLGAQV